MALYGRDYQYSGENRNLLILCFYEYEYHEYQPLIDILGIDRHYEWEYTDLNVPQKLVFLLMRPLSAILFILACCCFFNAPALEIASAGRVISKVRINHLVKPTVTVIEANERISNAYILGVKRGYDFSFPCEILLFSAYILLLINTEFRTKRLGCSRSNHTECEHKN